MEHTEQKPRFIPTTEGCFVDTGAVFRSADGQRIEFLEYLPASAYTAKGTFDEHQAAAAACTIAGGGWHVASPQELVASAVNYAKEDPASDLPDADSNWYWTNQVDPSSPGSALYVDLRLGHVSWRYRLNRGRARFVRLVPASQFLTLGQ